MTDDWLGRLNGHVFISYVREDAKRAERLADALTDAGIRVWRDTANLHPGQDWRIEIRRAIDDGSLAFLACFSRYSETRQVSFQNEELILAVDQMRRRPPGASWLIPVRFDECRLPEFDIGNGRTLDNLQRVDLLDEDWPMLGRLIMSIARILGKEAKSESLPADQGKLTTSDEWTDSSRRALDGGRNRYALTLAENGLKVAPLNAQLQFVRGASLHRLGRSAEALEPLYLADDIEANNQEVKDELTKALLQTGDVLAAYKVSPVIAESEYRAYLLSGSLEDAWLGHQLWPADNELMDRLIEKLTEEGGLESLRDAFKLAPHRHTVERRYVDILIQNVCTVQEWVGPERWDDKHLHEVIAIFDKLSAPAQKKLDAAIREFIRRRIHAVGQYREYDRARALYFVQLIERLEHLDLSEGTTFTLRYMREEGVYHSSGDNARAIKGLACALVAALVTEVIIAIFFTSWADGLRYSMGVLSIGMMITFGRFGPGTMRWRRRLALERATNRR